MLQSKYKQGHRICSKTGTKGTVMQIERGYICIAWDDKIFIDSYHYSDLEEIFEPVVLCLK